MTDTDTDPKLLAIAKEFSLDPEQIAEIEATAYDDCTFEVPGEPGEYLVLDEFEREERWDAALQSCLDECVLHELPEAMRCYFDEAAWKRDARIDGAGHALSGYDGNEREVQIDGAWFYIYRTN